MTCAAEWEFACRSGTTTSRYYGQSITLMPFYAWCKPNSGLRTQRSCLLKPNDSGLFDMYGNVWERCLDAYSDLGYPNSENGPVEDPISLKITQDQTVRSSSFTETFGFQQKSEYRAGMRNRRYSNLGFRVARTLKVED